MTTTLTSPNGYTLTIMESFKGGAELEWLGRHMDAFDLIPLDDWVTVANRKKHVLQTGTEFAWDLSGIILRLELETLTYQVDLAPIGNGQEWYSVIITKDAVLAWASAAALCRYHDDLRDHLNAV